MKAQALIRTAQVLNDTAQALVAGDRSNAIRQHRHGPDIA